MMGHAAHGASSGMFALNLTMWAAMMAAMMAPVAWPWVQTFRGLLVPSANTAARWKATLAFVSGYLVAWLAYAAVAAVVQTALSAAGMLDEHGRVPNVAGAAILMAAGVFQVTPFKRACLAHCRNPLTFLLTRWQNGPPSAFRIGLVHGAYCVGCCWALMATMVAIGLANLWWMIALTVAVFVEQTVPRGDWIRLPIAMALLGAGLRELM